MVKKIVRKFTAFFLCLTLCLTTVACGGPRETTIPPQTQNISQNQLAATSANTQLSDGKYLVQQASYNDVNGEYSLFLLNTPPGTPPTFRSANLQLARLTDEEIKAGQKSYLKVENGQPILYLTADFKIEYIHTVTQTQTNSQTGQQETVVVRQERGGFWAPFAGALAGQAIGSLLFRPHYYVPPVYQPGATVLTGFGGYGSNYAQAVEHYQTRYNQPPLSSRSRQPNLRTTGRLRTSLSYEQPTVAPLTNGSRATGSGYGSRNLPQSGRASGTIRRPPPSRSFGGARSFSRSR